MRDAAIWRLKFLNEESECMNIRREKYEMSTPYQGTSDFVHKQVDEVLEKYDAWLEEKERT